MKKEESQTPPLSTSNDLSSSFSQPSSQFLEPHEHIVDSYVKYNCNWTQAQPLSMEQLDELNHWRQKLYDLHLIGAYSNNIGFGNISIRIPKTNQFIITGTQTGNIKNLDEEHYTIVTQVNLEKNMLDCTGPIAASSEAMTHAAAYEAGQSIHAIVHVHSPTMWSKLYGKIPTSTKTASYGSPEIAQAIGAIVKNEKKHPVLIVMGGHETGIICVGKSLDEVGNYLIKVYKKFKLSPSNT